MCVDIELYELCVVHLDPKPRLLIDNGEVTAQVIGH